MSRRGQWNKYYGSDGSTRYAPRSTWRPKKSKAPLQLRQYVTAKGLGKAMAGAKFHSFVPLQTVKVCAICGNSQSHASHRAY